MVDLLADARATRSAAALCIHPPCNPCPTLINLHALKQASPL